MTIAKTLAKAALASSLALALSGTALAEGQVIRHAGDTPSQTGSLSMFTGTVRQDFVARPDAFSKSGICYVTFEPGARTFWHTHGAGQRLLVVSGKGLVGTADGVTQVVRTGDYIWCPPGVTHWHGAHPNTAMTHIALTNTDPEKKDTWGRALSDEEYARLAAGAEDPLKPTKR